MWRKNEISVVLPTYREKKSIRKSINEFFETGIVDEVIVVNNNAEAGTSEEVAKTRAREIFEERQGYGWAIRRGLEEAKGDIIVVSEPDGTFLGRDIFKLLAYADDFDVVFGTRTSKELVWEGANMGIFLKWGNWAVAKLMEFLFNTIELTDVGCTMRLLKRRALAKISPYFSIGGNYFGPEMMLLTVEKKIKFIQIPVNYKKRVGESSVTGDFWKAFILGIQMIGLILFFRVRTVFFKR